FDYSLCTIAIQVVDRGNRAGGPASPLTVGGDLAERGSGGFGEHVTRDAAQNGRRAFRAHEIGGDWLAAGGFRTFDNRRRHRIEVREQGRDKNHNERIDVLIRE